jgi:hypothetical protein
MKEFLSKFTFGFLLAQLVPGAVAVLFVSMVVAAYAWQSGEPSGAVLLRSALEQWSFRHGYQVVIFLVCSIGAGLLIHGLNWTVLAWLENGSDPLANGDEQPTGTDDGMPLNPVSSSFWHEWRIIWQVLLGPVKMTYEAASLPFQACGISALVMDENVTKIRASDEPLFNFVQDFYLYFAQFYAHTAYALLLGLACLGWSLWVMGVAWAEALVLMVALYLLTSVLFLLGRVQYTSMCGAEWDIRNRAGWE